MAIEIYSMDQLQTLIRTGELPFGTGGTATHKSMGVIDSQFTVVGTVGSGVDDLMSYILPANTLDVDGKAIRITAWGDGTGVDSVEVIFHFGTNTKLLFANAGTFGWYLSAIVSRIEAGIQTGITLSGSGSVIFAQDLDTPLEDETADILIKLTGENTENTTDNAVKQQGMTVEILN